MSLHRVHGQVVVLRILHVVVVPVEIVRGPSKVVELMYKVDRVLAEVGLHQSPECHGGYIVRSQDFVGTLQQRGDTTGVLNDVNCLAVQERDETMDLRLIGAGRGNTECQRLLRSNAYCE